MRLEILKTAQVDRLAGPQLPHDDPDHGVVRAGRDVPVRRIAAEVDELADHIFDVCSRSVRVAERAYRIERAPPAAHFSPKLDRGPHRKELAQHQLIHQVAWSVDELPRCGSVAGERLKS